MGTRFRRLRLDAVTWCCSLLCSVTFLFWSHPWARCLGFGGILFLLLLPIACFFLGEAFLRWLRVPVHASHPFPASFLFGGVILMLVLLFGRLLISAPVRLVDGTLFLLALLAFAFAPERSELTRSPRSPWLAAAAVGLACAGATLWTQDLRSPFRHEGNQMVVVAWADTVVHAETVSQLSSDVSLLRLGGADLAPQIAGVYHWGSYVLPASLEACARGMTAVDTVVSFWIPFGFLFMGLAAFSLAAEWYGDVAGAAAVLGVLFVPTAPHYGVPIFWYSFHWLLAISIGLAYGIAASAAGLLLLSEGLRARRAQLLRWGFAFLFLSLFLKVHIALAAIPLSIFWVISCKTEWSRAQRWSGLLLACTVGGLIAFWFGKIRMGPNMFPDGHLQGASYFSDFVVGLPPGFWRHLTMNHVFFKPWFHPLGLTFVLTATVLGAWLLIWIVLLINNRRLRRPDAFRRVPVLALGIFLFFALLLPPNQRGGIDELWHRPFVWLYFLVAVWCSAQLALLVEERSAGTWQPYIALLAVAVLLTPFPFREGKSIQHEGSHQADLVDQRVPWGWLQCARFVRKHSAPMDVVQDQASSMYPMLPAFSERRAYLGRDPRFWSIFSPAGPSFPESERRKQELNRLREKDTLLSLQQELKLTGIQWYVAAPQDNLLWPRAVLDHPAFTAEGFRVYDLRTMF